MSTAAIKEEGEEIVRSAQEARLAIQVSDWGMAERMLTEAQDRIGRLLRAVGDKQREDLMVPKPDQGDRG